MRGIGIGGAAAVAMVLSMAACAAPTDGGEGSEGTVQVRLMNAAAGTPALDLVIGGKVVAGSVGYEQASPLRNAPAGTQTLAIRRSGETTDLTTKQLSLTKGSRYTVMVWGSLASLALSQQTMALDTGLAKPDRANIRIINISTFVFPADSSSLPPSVPLNVFITAPGADLGTVAPVLSLDARAASYSTLIYFDPGSYVVRFMTPGTTNVVAGTPTIPIAAGQIPGGDPAEEVGRDLAYVGRG